MIPFDYPALFAAMGGEDKVIPRLDRFFLKLRCWGEPCYNIENEPDFVVPYAYVFAGQPWKTQEVVTRIAKEVFKNAPDGIPGNDDLGATSGVYVWDALGFTPPCPASAAWFWVRQCSTKPRCACPAERRSSSAVRAKASTSRSVTLDGAAYPKSWLPLAKLHTGTTRIDFTVAATPDKQRGAAIADRPPSFR
jgi:putative alpha-1,2-mannosidase